MTTLETLTAARDLLADPSRWHKNFIARDVARDPCPFDHAEAVSWCAMGALLRCSDGISLGSLPELERSFPAQWQGQTLTDFNDHPQTTHADVLALFDQTIARLQKDS